MSRPRIFTDSKVCTGCALDLPLEAFNRKCTGASNRAAKCKKCVKDNVFTVRRTVPQDVKRRQACERSALWRKQNVERANARGARWKQANRDKVSAYARRRRSEHMPTKLAANLRSRLRCVFDGKEKPAPTLELLGCSIAHFQDHIQSMFLTGMSWANYGNLKGQWSLDHRLPLASFDLTDDAQVKVACHFSNIQPMWAVENSRKRDRIA